MRTLKIIGLVSLFLITISAYLLLSKLIIPPKDTKSLNDRLFATC